MTASTLRSVTFGTPSNNDALTVRFGIEQGVFERLGIALDVRTLFGGPAIAAAFDSGEIGVGSLGSPSGLVPLADGARFKVVASGCRQRAHMYLGVRNSITTYAGLVGARIGVLSIGSCPSWIVHRILRHHGLDPTNDVELVPLHEHYPRIVDRVESGHLDGCLVTEPNLSIGEARGVLNTWAAAYDEPYLPSFQWIVRVANEALLRSDPELVGLVLDGCKLSAHYAVAHQGDFAEFVARYYGTSVEAVRTALARELPRYQLDGALDIEGLETAVQMMHELGGIKAPIPLTDFCDMRFQ